LNITATLPAAISEDLLRRLRLPHDSGGAILTMTDLDYRVLIVGAGPAGVSTWLHLRKLDPSIADNTKLIESEFLPKEKLCGGGITRLGDKVLKDLGVEIEVPSVPIKSIDFRYCGRNLRLERDRGFFRIVHRYEFDHALVKAAFQRGLLFSQGERLLDYQITNSHVLVNTTSRTYRVAVLVGADGANSFIRSKLLRNDELRIGRLLEIDLEPRACQFIPDSTRAMFDFSYLNSGLQGYIWAFPQQQHGERLINYGIYDSRVDKRKRLCDLKNMADESLKARSADKSDRPWKGHPIRWFSPTGSYSGPRVILVGDAAGVDPLFGEGISYALQYGSIAAREILWAFRLGNFSFSTYREHLLAHPLGKSLALRSKIAKILYAGWSPVALNTLFSLLSTLGPLYVSGSKKVRSKHIRIIKD
jgi:menaquinone-9 beta-reductase